MSATFLVPGPLRQYAAGQAELELDGDSVRGMLDQLAGTEPALERRIRDEQGQLRRHLMIFVDGSDVRETGGLDTPVVPGAQVLVVAAISGG